jgi:hypothetical protein
MDNEVCATCGGELTDPYHMCDETMESYCAKCWEETPCAHGAHGEGCETVVYTDD